MSRPMKDSGTVWIGKVPEDWDVHRIGFQYTTRNVKVSDENWPPLSVTKNGIVPQLDGVAKTSSNNDRKQVLAGDFVINSRSDRKQSCGLSELDGSISLINTVLSHSENATIHPHFTKYLLDNYGFAEEFYRWGTGIVADLWSTRWESMKSIEIPVPPIHEQIVIYKFLDENVSIINCMIALQEEMIAELQAYKQSIITEAVTKGLNSDTIFKDVGVIPHHVIPRHWKMVKVLRCLSMKITDGPHETPEFFDEGIPFISAEAIKDGVIRFDLMRGRISEEYYTECCKKYTPLNNDIFMVKSGATTGSTAMLEDDIVFTIWSPLAVFRANELVLPKVLHYILQSNIFQKQIQLNWSFGTQQNIGMRVLESLLIPLIPIDEQRSIAAYLDNECCRIARLIGIKQAKINALKKYKQSLIYECVTGKRDCRPQEERA